MALARASPKALKRLKTSALAAPRAVALAAAVTLPLAFALVRPRKAAACGGLAAPPIGSLVPRSAPPRANPSLAPYPRDCLFRMACTTTTASRRASRNPPHPPGEKSPRAGLARSGHHHHHRRHRHHHHHPPRRPESPRPPRPRGPRARKPRRLRRRGSFVGAFAWASLSASFGFGYRSSRRSNRAERRQGGRRIAHHPASSRAVRGARRACYAAGRPVADGRGLACGARLVAPSRRQGSSAQAPRYVVPCPRRAPSPAPRPLVCCALRVLRSASAIRGAGSVAPAPRSPPAVAPLSPRESVPAGGGGAVPSLCARCLCCALVRQVV